MKKVIVQFAFILAVIVVFISGASAATVSCDGSFGDCQTKITAASDGDTITIPSGTFTWATSASWIDKNISIIGAGEGVTIINVPASGFYVHTNYKAAFRISSMTINQTVNGTAIKIENYKRTPVGGSYSPGWRLDHLTITANGLTDVRSIFILGLTYGVIDHVTWSSDYSIAQFLTHYGYTNDNSEMDGTPFNQGKIAWGLNHSLGDANAIYVEDSTLNASSKGGWAADVWMGGEVVFRHNTINRCQISTHGGRYTARGGRRMEVYNNIFVAQGMNDNRVVWWRSGTGVVFNNTIDAGGFISIDNQRTCLAMDTRCDGINGNAYDMNTDGTGWPCLDQPGRGYGPPRNQTSVPIYAWNNGKQEDCRTTRATCTNTKNIGLNGNYDLCLSSPSVVLSSHLKTGAQRTRGAADYVNNGTTPKPGYTPYTYPHPLNGLATVAPPPPTGLATVTPPSPTTTTTTTTPTKTTVTTPPTTTVTTPKTTTTTPTTTKTTTTTTTRKRIWNR